MRIPVSFSLFLLAPVFLAAQDLPKADSILDRYVEVTGGKALHSSVKSQTMKGSMVMAAQGLQASILTYVAEGKSHSTVEIPGMGKMEEGVSDGVAWGKSAMTGPRVKDGKDRDRALEAAMMARDARWREIYAKAETTGTETIAGDECYKVALTTKSGVNETRFYSKKSGLLLQMSTIQPGPMGEIPITVLVDNYKKLSNGLLAPHTTTMKVAGQEMKLSFDSITLNEPAPAGVFDIPADVQALVKKETAPAPK